MKRKKNNEIDEYKGLVINVARRYFNPFTPFDDIIQVGYEGLLKGLKEYESRQDIRCKYTKTMYLGLRVKSEILNYNRSLSNIIRLPYSAIKNEEPPVFLDINNKIEHNSEESIGDYCIGKEDNTFDTLVYQDLLSKIRRILNDYEYDVFRIYFLEDLKWPALALSLRHKKTQSVISVKKKRILKKLQKHKAILAFR